MPRTPIMHALALGAAVATASPALAEVPKKAPATKRATKPSVAQVEADLLRRMRALPGKKDATRKTDVLACCDSMATFRAFKATADAFGAKLPRSGRLRDTPTPEMMAKAIVRHVSPR